MGCEIIIPRCISADPSQDICNSSAVLCPVKHRLVAVPGIIEFGNSFVKSIFPFFHIQLFHPAGHRSGAGEVA
jgi:hypothetical protein